MRVRVKRHGDTYVARLRTGGVELGAVGSDGASALHNAARLLDAALDRPEVKELLPPGTTVALRVLRGAAGAIRRGNLDEYLQRLPREAGKRVLRTLRKVLPW